MAHMKPMEALRELSFARAAITGEAVVYFDDWACVAYSKHHPGRIRVACIEGPREWWESNANVHKEIRRLRPRDYRYLQGLWDRVAPGILALHDAYSAARSTADLAAIEAREAEEDDE